MPRLPRPFRLSGAAFAAGLLATACNGAPAPDAYGNVEATDVVVGAQGAGQLLWFTPAEGDTLSSGSTVGAIDTTSLALELHQAGAQRAATAARTDEVDRQIGVLRVQQEIARRTLDRTERLFAEHAATAPQRDQAEKEYRVLGEQIAAAQAQRASVQRDVAAADARMAQIRDRIRKSLVTNPRAGTVLDTYARAGEVVQVGQPLYRIADLDTVDVRAYVGETRLSALRLGAPAVVTADTRGARRSLNGRITWISSQAEFTPTPIQTREERADLVYAFKIRVANPEGALKIGMPVDVALSPVTASR
jgi:HlyD family secretion protein